MSWTHRSGSSGDGSDGEHGCGVERVESEEGREEGGCRLVGRKLRRTGVDLKRMSADALPQAEPRRASYRKQCYLDRVRTMGIERVVAEDRGCRQPSPLPCPRSVSPVSASRPAGCASPSSSYSHSPVDPSAHSPPSLSSSRPQPSACPRPRPTPNDRCRTTSRLKPSDSTSRRTFRSREGRRTGSRA